MANANCTLKLKDIQADFANESCVLSHIDDLESTHPNWQSLSNAKIKQEEINIKQKGKKYRACVCIHFQHVFLLGLPV